jgi:L-tartrate/succinate antiporter
LLFASLPVLVDLLYPPEVKRSEEVPVWAALELARLSPVTWPEVIMATIATAALGLWIFAGAWLNPAVVALIALAAMILSGVLDLGDVIGYKEAWNVLTWFGTPLS